MLPRLLLVVGLSVAVMLPLIWVAFVPAPDFQKVSKRNTDAAQSGSIGTDSRAAPTPGAAEPSNPIARSDGTTIGTAPDSEREALARSDDLPGAGHSEPTDIKPKLPQPLDKDAAPKPLVTEEAKAKPLPEAARPLPEEAKALPEAAKPLLEEAKPLPEEAKPLQKEAKSQPEEATTPAVGEREASSTRSDDLPAAGHSKPTEAKASLPGTFDTDAVPESSVTEKAEPPTEEAATPAVNFEKPPEVKESESAPVATPNGRARARAHSIERQKTHRKKQKDHSGWVGIMRGAGWVAPNQRR